MDIFHDLLRDVLVNGTTQYNTRTKLNCKVLVGAQLKFNLANGFPAITSKKLAFNAVKGELLGFFRGYTNAADFRKLGCKIWDENANETRSWLDNPSRVGTDDLGRIYGAQWTNWLSRRVATSITEVERLQDDGYIIELYDALSHSYGLVKSINQLEKVLSGIITNPSDRRLIVSGWNVGELDLMALPPCHMDYRFVPFEDTKTLNVVMTIRSWDLFLGAPFNIASTALFLSIMARLSGYIPGTVVIQATNAHIYENHIDQVHELLERSHMPPPTLSLSKRITQITNLENIMDVFTRIEPDDIQLENYQSHSAIKAPMAK